MLKTGLWPDGNCHLWVNSGIWEAVRAKKKQKQKKKQWLTKEDYSSELIPSSSYSSSGNSSSTDYLFVRVNSNKGDASSSSQLIPFSSATSINTHNSFIQVVNSRPRGATATFFSSFSQKKKTGFPGFIQVKSNRGCVAAAASSHSHTSLSGGFRMKQRFEGKLNNASSSRNSNSSSSSLGSAAWRKPKVEEKREGWGDYAASTLKMQVGVKKELSSSLGDGQEERGKKDPTAVVKVEIEKMSNNSRKIDAKIAISAPLDVVWGILTDYEHLADFIPGLSESKCLEKKGNKCRLYQVGEQSLALGFKFKAKAVLECEEKPTKMLDKLMRRDIDFETVEGDFQVFRGTWRMEQQMNVPSPPSSGDGLGNVAERAGEGGGGGEEAVSTLLSYILVVQPKAWLPVGLVEGRLTSEIKTNLACIHDRSLVLQLPGS